MSMALTFILIVTPRIFCFSYTLESGCMCAVCRVSLEQYAVYRGNLTCGSKVTMKLQRYTGAYDVTWKLGWSYADSLLWERIHPKVWNKGRLTTSSTRGWRRACSLHILFTFFGQGRRRKRKRKRGGQEHYKYTDVQQPQQNSISGNTRCLNVNLFLKCITQNATSFPGLCSSEFYARPLNPVAYEFKGHVSTSHAGESLGTRLQ